MSCGAVFLATRQPITNDKAPHHPIKVGTIAKLQTHLSVMPFILKPIPPSPLPPKISSLSLNKTCEPCHAVFRSYTYKQ